MLVDSVEPDLRIWGKARGLSRPYPLLWHLLDAAAVAGALWDHYLTASQRGVIARGLGVGEEHARSLVTFWAGLHDIGKATPGFQCKVDDAFAVLTADGDLPDNGARWLGHDEASQLALVEYLEALEYPQHIGLWPLGSACRVAQVVGAHHGRFKEVTQQQTATEAKTRRRLGGGGWPRQRQALFDAIYEAVGRPAPPREWAGPTRAAVSVQAAVLLVGVVVVADWLASQEHVIAAQQRACSADAKAASVRDHFARTAAQGPDLLAGAGLGRPRVEDRSFADVFGFAPNPLQRSIMDEFVDSVRGSGLLVVTAATGDGKTEAGLVAARALAAVSGADGLYFALPTMATADQMYRRVATFTTQVATGPTPVTLLHSMSWLNAEYSSRASARVADSVAVVSDDRDTTTLASAWLRGHRRGLLAPYAVGTVDQALIAVLAVKHNALRLLGLAGKVLVVDEAHAYDAYMQALLRCLLAWLGALRCPVVLLSATLPSTVSGRLIEAYLRGTGRDRVDPAAYRVDYPGWLYVAADPEAPPVQISPGGRRALAEHRVMDLAVDICPVRHVPDGPTGSSQVSADERRRVVRALLDPVRIEGGCIGVICNTVQDAQGTFLALRGWRADGVAIELLHSRFPARIREAITQRVIAAVGRDGSSRPQALIVVGTQIIEQSLDLDFDLVVSDLAPIAQLLQRAGRCHRHTRPVGTRPAWLGRPRLAVLDPRGLNGAHVKPPHWGLVYQPYLLRATHVLLAERSGEPIRLPQDVQDLVETVYVNSADGPSFADDAVLDAEWVASQADEYAQRGMADFVAIPPPSRVSDLAALSKKQVEEADAVTRLGADSARVVCCFLDEDGQRWLDAERRRRLPERGSQPDGRFTADEVREILAETIPVRADEVRDIGDKHAVPRHWQQNTWLRDLVLLPHRLTSSGVEPARCGRHAYALDPELGLQQLLGCLA